MLLARGAVTDRPWGQTLGALGMKQLTGQVSVVADDKSYEIAFDLGSIVAATSPLVSDAAVRIALTNHLISKAVIPDITRRIAASPERDDVDIIAETTRLSPDHIDQLRRRVIAARAARTLSLESGEFEVHDLLTLPTVPGIELDVQAVIYLGARMNISEQRLADALRSFGEAWVLGTRADAMLSKFGFSEEAERTVIEELRRGTSLPELEAAHRDIDPRAMNAIIYALMSCGACEVQDAPVVPRAGTSTVTAAAHSAIASAGSAADGVPRRPSSPSVSGGIAAARTATREAPPAPYGPFVARTSTSDGAPPVPRTTSREPYRDASLGEYVPRTSTRDPNVARTSSRDSTPAIARTATSPAAVRREFDDGAATPAAVRASRGNPSSPPVNVSSGRTPTPGGSRSVGGRSITDDPFAPPTTGRAQTPTSSSGSYPAIGRVPTGQLTTGMTNGSVPGIPRTTTGQPRPPTNAPPVTGRVPTGQPVTGRSPTGDPAISRTSTARRTKALIAARIILLEQNADYYALLGVPFDAAAEVVRTTYLNLSRALHPDKLTDVGVDDPTGAAGRLFAAISHAFAVLTDPIKRNDYMVALLRGDNPFPVTARTKTNEERTNDAAEAFRRGESAMRRDDAMDACVEFAKAVELSPSDVDYQAMLGWAQFCAATDRVAASKATRLALERACQKSVNPVPARFLLGRVERMLGRDREALHHFQQVIDLQANHAEAASEIRAIEARARMKK